MLKMFKIILMQYNIFDINNDQILIYDNLVLAIFIFNCKKYYLKNEKNIFLNIKYY